MTDIIAFLPFWRLYRSTFGLRMVAVDLLPFLFQLKYFLLSHCALTNDVKEVYGTVRVKAVSRHLFITNIYTPKKVKVQQPKQYPNRIQQYFISISCILLIKSFMLSSPSFDETLDKIFFIYTIFIKYLSNLNSQILQQFISC